jgi:hypothetical protein
MARTERKLMSELTGPALMATVMLLLQVFLEMLRLRYTPEDIRHVTVCIVSILLVLGVLGGLAVMGN